MFTTNSREPERGFDLLSIVSERGASWPPCHPARQTEGPWASFLATPLSGTAFPESANHNSHFSPLRKPLVGGERGRGREGLPAASASRQKDGCPRMSRRVPFPSLFSFPTVTPGGTTVACRHLRIEGTARNWLKSSAPSVL